MFILILLLCSALFIGIGVYAIYKKTPMWFWAGTEEEEMRHMHIYDVKEFNQKNGRMWIFFGSLFLIPIILSRLQVFPEWILGIFIIFLCVFGTIIMMVYWEYLQEKFTKK